MRWEMAEAHSVIIRGFDVIYENINTILEDDYNMWVNFLLVWTNFVHHHHDGEELFIFPKLTKIEEMEINKKQHEEFLPLLEDLQNHLNNCIINKEKYSSEKVKNIINKMHEPLFKHFSEELDTLSPKLLEKHYDETYIENIENEHLEWTKSTLSLNKDMVFIYEFRNNNINYPWPNLPWFLEKLIIPCAKFTTNGYWKWAPGQ
jgi:hypothetical protein